MPTATSRSSKMKQANAKLAAARRLRLPAPRILRLKHIKRPSSLSSVWRLSKQTALTLWRHRWVFLGIALVYTVLNIVFVTGFGGGTDIAGLKQGLGITTGSSAGQLATSLNVFSSLVTSGTGVSSASSGAYQLFITLIVSLAVIWVLRQSAAGEQVALKDAFYRGMYPLIPFIFVLAVVLLQLLPILVGGTIYSFVTAAGIAVTPLEQLGVLLLLVVIPAVISAYMVTASLFALYIVTLPDVMPLQALRSAKKLVHYRRAVVFRKLLFLPIVLVLMIAVIVVPVIFFIPVIASWLFMALGVLGLVVAHTYMYTLYRELLA